MAYDIKLNVFTISLRERHKKRTQLSWSELFEKFPGRTYEKKFQTFFVAYIKHFDGKFTVYDNWNKGISIGKNAVTYGSAGNFIIGKAEGGPTNLVGLVKAKGNIDDPGFQVTRDHVSSIPHYFILWMPKDSNKGLMIVQSLGDRTIYEPLKLNFKKFVESVDEKFYVDFNEHVSEEAIRKMKERGRIKQLVLRKSSLPSDMAERVFNKKYHIVDNLNIEIRITGFGNSTAAAIKDFFKGSHPDLLEFGNMKGIGLDEGSDILATFEHNKKTATAKFDNFSIAPIYYVDTTDVPLNASNHPDETKMREYLLSFLSKMKVEIGYDN